MSSYAKVVVYIVAMVQLWIFKHKAALHVCIFPVFLLFAVSVDLDMSHTKFQLARPMSRAMDALCRFISGASFLSMIVLAAISFC